MRLRFEAGEIEGLVVVRVDPIADERGYFARAWCRREFGEQGLEAEWQQSNLQSSPTPGTLRGLHYQVVPHEEVKLVRCTRGAVFDVAVDLRPASPTFKSWHGIELRAQEPVSVWIPPGCAHGYVTLEPESQVFYLTSHEYIPTAATGVRYDDPAFGITWPRSIETIADRDLAWDDFDVGAASG